MSEQKSFPLPVPKAPKPIPEILRDVPVPDADPDWVEKEKRRHLELQETSRQAAQAAEDAATPEGILKSRRFDHRIEPPHLRAIYSLAGTVVATPGNLVAIAAAVKAGKSAVIGAMCASTMTASGEVDLLGFASGNPYHRAVVWVDSEQSPDDFWHCVMRAIKRAGVAEPPDWLHAYCLTGLDCKTAWECVLEAVRAGAEAHGGVHSVLLDGIADFVPDVNDAEQCNAFIAQAHSLAIEHDCPIVGVIHFNPDSAKTRGHLGSQFERKAETNLRLEKKDDVTVIWSDKQRRAPIPRSSGPCFTWDDEAGMHASCENPAQAKAEASQESRLGEMRAEAQQVFAQEKNPMRHKEAVEKMAAVLKLSEVGAKKKLRKWRECNIVAQESSGRYTLAQSP